MATPTEPGSGCHAAVRAALAGHRYLRPRPAHPDHVRRAHIPGRGFVATAVALLIGVTWGAIAGYAGGRVDAVMMRLVDILYALPFMIFIVLLMVVFGRNMLLLFLAIGAVEWLTMARIMRGQVQSLRQQEFVEAAISLGLSPPPLSAAT